MSPFPLLCWFLLATFLGILSLLALGVTRLAAPRELGGHPRGFFGGLGALVALAFLGGVGLLGLGATALTMGVGSLIEWNPIRRIEVQRDPGRAPAAAASGDERHGPRSEVLARVTVREGAAAELVDFLHQGLGLDLDEVGQALTVHQRRDEDGAGFEVYEFRLPVSERDLARLERDIERDFQGLDLELPQGIGVELAPRP